MVLTLGELMLRLKPPGKSRLLQVPLFEAGFGGSEANTAAALVRLGHSAHFLSVLPLGPLGDSAQAFLRHLGIDDSMVRRKSGRLGIYFLEEGALNRPSQVFYDREFSCVAEVETHDWEWDEIFENTTWFHVSGITPALSMKALEWTRRSVSTAVQGNIPISLDINFRKKLWNYGQDARLVLPRLVEHCHVLFSNEDDLFNGLGEDFKPLSSLDENDPQARVEAVETNARLVFEKFPKLEVLGLSLRESKSADSNVWSGALCRRNKSILFSNKYLLEPIVDRIGAGDAFNAGFIAGFLEKLPDQSTLELAVAMGALKHSIPGDVFLGTRLEAENLAKGKTSGRVNR